jgi:hypothetical protein
VITVGWALATQPLRVDSTSDLPVEEGEFRVHGGRDPSAGGVDQRPDVEDEPVVVGRDGDHGSRAEHSFVNLDRSLPAPRRLAGEAVRMFSSSSPSTPQPPARLPAAFVDALRTHARLLVAVALLALLAAPAWPSTVDDVYISLTYARHWAESGALKLAFIERILAHPRESGACGVLGGLRPDQPPSAPALHAPCPIPVARPVLAACTLPCSSAPPPSFTSLPTSPAACSHASRLSSAPPMGEGTASTAM